jgi:hypothetical protein
MAPHPNKRQRLIICCRCLFFFFDRSDLFGKYSRFHSIFHSNIQDEKNAAILNDGDVSPFTIKNGNPSIAPNNGQINEHCRGPSVPAKYVPIAIAIAVQNAINNDKKLF